jgi:hypothetical protein
MPLLVANCTVAGAEVSPVRCTLMVALPAFSLTW